VTLQLGGCDEGFATQVASVTTNRTSAGGFDLRLLGRLPGTHHATVYKTLGIETLGGIGEGNGETRESLPRGKAQYS
jgi:hypothetical protein